MFKIIVVVFLFSLSLLVANEPSWTEKERTEKRDLVVVASIQSLNVLPSKEKNEYLIKAVAIINKEIKGKKGKNKVIFYYHLHKKGIGRCPSYPALSISKTYKLFLTHIPKKEKGYYFLEMGSDVIAQKSNP
jgi:hypothetical protein